MVGFVCVCVPARVGVFVKVTFLSFSPSFPPNRTSSPLMPSPPLSPTHAYTRTRTLTHSLFLVSLSLSLSLSLSPSLRPSLSLSQTETQRPGTSRQRGVRWGGEANARDQCRRDLCKRGGCQGCLAMFPACPKCLRAVTPRLPPRSVRCVCVGVCVGVCVSVCVGVCVCVCVCVCMCMRSSV